MSNPNFSKDELDRLRAHGIAIFRGRVILEARPPIDASALAVVEAQIGAPVPAGLRALWEVSFGGELDYDLEVMLGERRHSTSFRELFYPGSDRYRDLPGWIEHERELAEEAARADGVAAPSALAVAPFGGFEYLERLYVSLRPRDLGAVLIWAQGLPPAWKMSLTADTVGLVAESIEALFDQLSLSENPFADGADPNANGIAMAEAHDEVAKEDPGLAAKLRALIEASVFDWRALVAEPWEGSALQRRACDAACSHAASEDDVDLLRQLIAGKFPMDGIVSGNATTLTLAAAKRAHRVVEALLDADVPLGDAPIIFAEKLPPASVERLIARGVAFDVDAVLCLVETGDAASARLVLERGRRHGEYGDVSAAARKRADGEARCAASIKAGKMSSYLSADEHGARAERLRAFSGG